MADATESADIAIVGGGICGLTTALALEQRGFEPTVYEATSEYRPVGAGILLQTNALLAFERLGLVDRLRTSGQILDVVRIRSPGGRVLQQFEIDAVERAEFGHGFVAIHRADLQRILLDELDTTVETGMPCTTVERTDTPTVRFEDGTHVQPDVVVGADGIDSTVRDTIAPDVERRGIDTVAYRALVTLDQQIEHPREGFEVWGDGTFTGGTLVDDEQFYWYATAPERFSEDPREAAGLLGERFGAFPEPISSVAKAVTPDDFIVTELTDLPSLERWYRGSTVLAGDAAHGMLPFAGQGAAQGVEDALVLAHALDTHESVPAALESYERERKPRADRIRAESRRLGRVGTIQSSVGWQARNLALGLLPGAVLRRFRRRRVSGTTLPEPAVSEDGEVSNKSNI